jgi:enoyl-CoA hydratase/carnithine racemase
MCGERIDAPRLKELGLVNQVSVPGQALSAALALSARLNAMAPNVLATNKELINSALQSSLNTQLAAERDHFVRNLHHANAGIGIDAFLSKQNPKFV